MKTTTKKILLIGASRSFNGCYGSATRTTWRRRCNLFQLHWMKSHTSLLEQFLKAPAKQKHQSKVEAGKAVSSIENHCEHSREKTRANYEASRKRLSRRLKHERNNSLTLFSCHTSTLFAIFEDPTAADLTCCFNCRPDSRRGHCSTWRLICAFLYMP